MIRVFAVVGRNLRSVVGSKNNEMQARVLLRTGLFFISLLNCSESSELYLRLVQVIEGTLP